MTFFWIIVIIVVVWWLASQSKKTVAISVSNNKDAEEKRKEITEELVFNAQTKFEKKLNEEIDFPDAITGREIYVYRNLMCPWYRKLSGENRYNEEMTQKLRNDWLDYMSSIADQSTYNYLSMEFYDEKDNSESDSYRNDHILASRKMFAIEDAFAATVGKDAVDELSNVRKIDSWGVFDKFGNRAPEGFKYDLRDELKLLKTKKETDLFLTL